MPSADSRSHRMWKAENLARKVDAFVWSKGTEFGASRAAARLGLEPATVSAVLADGPKSKAERAEAALDLAIRREYESPQRLKVFEAIRENPDASMAQISELTGVKLRYVQKVARDLKAQG